MPSLLSRPARLFQRAYAASPGTYDVNSFKRSSTAHLATRWGQNRENSLTEDFSTPFAFYWPLTVLWLTTPRERCLRCSAMCSTPADQPTQCSWLWNS